MNKKQSKKDLGFSKTMFRGAFIYNPVLTQAIGICTIVAIGATLKIALAFSILLSALLIIMEVLSSLVLTKFSRWLRISAYMLISTMLLLPVMLFMDKSFSEISAAMGIYLPLLAANSIIVIRCEIFAVNNKVRNSLLDALASSLGFFGVAVIVGAVRELIAYGTILGFTVSHLPVLSGLSLPFGGLLVIGFTAALHRFIIIKKYPRYQTSTFNLRTAFDTPTIKNEGIRVTDGTLSLMRDPVAADEDDELPRNYSEEEKLAAKKLFDFGTEDEDDDVPDTILKEKSEVPSEISENEDTSVNSDEEVSQ